MMIVYVSGFVSIMIKVNQMINSSRISLALHAHIKSRFHSQQENHVEIVLKRLVETKGN